MNTQPESYQHNLLKAIWEERAGSSFEPKGLAIYRANLRATAAQALSVTFPTVSALIGEELFQSVAERLLFTSPPTQGDWAQWGEALPALLQELDELQEYPFVADCALLDWHYHRLARAQDLATQSESLVLLEEHEPAHIYVELAPSLTFIESQYPITEIRSAHQLSEVERQERLQALIQTGSFAKARTFACYRNGFEVNTVELTAAEQIWYQYIQQHSLGEALDQMDLHEFSFAEWLLAGVQTNLIHKFFIRHSGE